MKIGILQTGYVNQTIVGEYGEYPPMFERLLEGRGFDFSTFKVLNMEFPKSITQMDGWLITGSVHGAYEDHAFIPPLETFIRNAHTQSIPMVGVCFGHQIMAQALGGKVEKFAGGWNIGKIRYHTPDGDHVWLNASHQDQVIEKPADARVILTNDKCLNAGLVYEKPALSFQPHPEFARPFMAELIRLRAGRGITREHAVEAIAGLDDHVDATLIADQISDFFRRNSRSALKDQGAQIS